MRLRWGILELTAGKYVSIFSQTESNIYVWEHNFEDEWKGMFNSDDECKEYQQICAEKLIQYYNGK